MRAFHCLMIGLAATALSVQDARCEEKAEPENVRILGGVATLEVPAVFKRGKPANRIIEHEFKASAGKGDDAKSARLYMMGAGGGVGANIDRWKSQLTGGKPEDQKTEELTVGDWKVHVVDLTGSFAEKVGGGGPFAPGKTVQRENYAMAGAILVHPEGRTYFVKMIGPAEVVTANRKAFVTMIKSVKK